METTKQPAPMPPPEPGIAGRTSAMGSTPQELSQVDATLDASREKQQPSLIMDELEAGEAAVEPDDKEPQEVLSWAIDRFGKELAICCSVQADGCALIDMAHKIDPNIRVFTTHTGPNP